MNDRTKSRRIGSGSSAEGPRSLHEKFLHEFLVPGDQRACLRNLVAFPCRFHDSFAVDEAGYQYADSHRIAITRLGTSEAKQHASGAIPLTVTTCLLKRERINCTRGPTGVEAEACLRSKHAAGSCYERPRRALFGVGGVGIGRIGRPSVGA